MAASSSRPARDRGEDAAAQTYEPPTDEQLERFVAVMALGPGYTPEQLETTRTMLELPELRQAWLDRHREMQEAAWNL